MTTDDDRFWDEVAGKLRKKKGLCPLTPEEAEAAFDEAPEIPLSEDHIHSIVESVKSGELASWDPVPDQPWSDDAALEEVGGQAMQLHRNKGEDDPETDALEREVEEELLSDDEPEEEHD